MSCASSSRTFLQPLINARNGPATSHGLFQLLCPRYFSSTDSRQVGSSTKSTSRKAGFATRTLSCYRPKSAVTKARIRQITISHKTAEHGRDIERDTEQQDDGTRLTMARVCVETEISDHTGIPVSQVSDSKHIIPEAVPQLQPFPKPTLNSDSDKHSESTSPTRILEIDKPKDTSLPRMPPELAAQEAEHLQKSVKEHIINHAARDWVNSKLRNKTSWSFDWTESARMLLTSMYEKATNDVQARKDSDSQTSTGSFQLVKNDYDGVPVSSIPVPTTWTQASFAQYVDDLSRSLMPSQLNRVLKKTGQPHERMVQTHLEEAVFTDVNSHLVSVQALESAIRFYCRFEFLPSVQRLFLYMQNQRIPYPDRCFDLILRKAALNKDCSNFTMILRRAINLGFDPNGMTWASFAICMLSSEASETIIEIMKQHNLLVDLKVRQDMAVDLLRKKLEEATPGLFTVEAIFSYVDAHLGQDWFSLQSANTILKYLCTAAPEQPISNFLELMSSRGYNPNINSLNLLLQRRRRVHDLKAAINVVAEFITVRGVMPNELTYWFLFSLAWKKQSLNTCRVLWAAACAYTRVSLKMGSGVFEALTGKKRPSASFCRPGSRRAGYLIIGLDPRNYSPKFDFSINKAPIPTQDPKLQNLQSVPSSYGLEVKHVDENAAKITKDAIAFIERDLEIPTLYYYPIRVFAKQLQTAWAMDKALAEKDCMALSLEEHMELMIQPHLSLKEEIKKDLFAPFYLDP